MSIQASHRVLSVLSFSSKVGRFPEEIYFVVYLTFYSLYFIYVNDRAIDMQGKDNTFLDFV